MKISIEGYEPKHVSYSALDGYVSCPKRYQLSRILQLEEKPGLASIAGNAVHSATELIDLAQFHGTSIDMLTKGEQ